MSKFDETFCIILLVMCSFLWWFLIFLCTCGKINCLGIVWMYHLCTMLTISFIKLWCFHRNAWNFLCMFWTLCWWFWCIGFNFWIPGWWDMNFWLEVWQFVSHHAWWISWFYLMCLWTLDWVEFLWNFMLYFIIDHDFSFLVIECASSYDLGW